MVDAAAGVEAQADKYGRDQQGDDGASDDVRLEGPRGVQRDAGPHQVGRVRGRGRRGGRVGAARGGHLVTATRPIPSLTCHGEDGAPLETTASARLGVCRSPLSGSLTCRKRAKRGEISDLETVSRGREQHIASGSSPQFPGGGRAALLLAHQQQYSSPDGGSGLPGLAWVAAVE